MNSMISQQDAAAAAKRILGFYDTIPAADPKAFAAGLTAMLAAFPRPVIDRATDPVMGIPAKVAYLNLAAIRRCFDEWNADHVRFERLRNPAPKQIEQPRDPEADARMMQRLKNLSASLGSSLTNAKPKGPEAA